MDPQKDQITKYPSKHMKALIVLVVGLLSVGCATVKDIGVHLGIGTPSSTKVEPVKELTPEQKQKALRDSVIGEYEGDIDGGTVKFVVLGNGVLEMYFNGKMIAERKWSIVAGEVHDIDEDGTIGVGRINKDKSVTNIAMIEDGKRTDIPKEFQNTWKKLKE